MKPRLAKLRADRAAEALYVAYKALERDDNPVAALRYARRAIALLARPRARRPR